MKKIIKDILTKKKLNVSYNLTSSSKTTFFYPKTYNELKRIIFFLKKEKEKALIKTGNCGHGDKSNLKNSKYAISLSRFDKIIYFSKKEKYIEAQAGVSLNQLFSYLIKLKHTILNIPGGKKVSLGGAISGNVHGRDSHYNYSTFGDNIISLKVMSEDGSIKIITNKKKIFYKIVGGLGLYKIILEAKLKVFKVENYYYEETPKLIKSEKEFKKYHKYLQTFFGYINPFNKNKLEGKFFHLIPVKELNNNKIIKLEKYTIISFLYYLGIIRLISFFVFPFTLKIFYSTLFLAHRFYPPFKNKRLLDIEKNIYISSINQYLPYFYRGGMIEIQFSCSERVLYYLISKLKNLFFQYNAFPFFFIVKKVHKSIKNYIFNFPKNNFSISMGFSKFEYENKKALFILLYKYLLSKKCNLYLTKDETFLENLNKKKIRKYIKSNFFKKSRIFSSDFKEKVLNK